MAARGTIERIQARASTAILMAGGCAGAIDFFYATAKTMMAGQPGTRPWMGVAAALFGIKTVRDVGSLMAVVGVALHFLITIGAAAAYFLIAVRQPFLLKHRWLSGIAFGCLFFLAMNYVIVPLSAIGRPIYNGASTIGYALIGHVVMIGLPIALIVAWRLSGRGAVGQVAS